MASLAAMAVSVERARSQSWRDLVGYTQLQSRLGGALPTGAGGVVSQVENAVTSGGAYYIDSSLASFNGSLDPRGLPVTFTDGSGGASHGISAHTSAVANRFYGDADSLAPGANNVVIYEVNHWLENILQYATEDVPLPQNYRVQNHSWVGTMASGNRSPQPHVEHPHNVSVLKRYDYLIERANQGAGMTAVVGVNNNTNPLPYLLSHSYNAIAVGRTDGNHSSGLTLAPDATPPDDSYGPGRSKPDVVAPLSSTSNATGGVSSAAALLYEALDPVGTAPNEVVKSLLLAGATKTEFTGWIRTPTQPLDDVFGAGELNVYNSYLMTLGGQQPGSQSPAAAAVSPFGWDYQDFKGNASVGDVYYNFEIPAGTIADELSIALAWNAEIEDLDASETGFLPSLALQDLNLELYSTTSTAMTLLDQSISAVDNVEHLYLRNLSPGGYALKVTGAADWDYGIAWRMNTRFAAPSADFNADGVVNGGDFLIWQQNVNTLVGATRATGDGDGDGDVDLDDLNLWKTTVIATPMPLAAAAIGAVPEPASLMIAAGLGAAPLVVAARRRPRRAA
ncbi:MAG: hypothetical protein DCC67_12995 [Planctomycetota bacterium]|nr:MAG: hypothetical protein DCC67_12995 [Planctomycetota bacterium]